MTRGAVVAMPALWLTGALQPETLQPTSYPGLILIAVAGAAESRLDYSRPCWAVIEVMELQ